MDLKGVDELGCNFSAFQYHGLNHRKFVDEGTTIILRRGNHQRLFHSPQGFIRFLGKNTPKDLEEQYRQKRTTGISDDEMLIQARKHLPQYFESDLDRIKTKAKELVTTLIKDIKDDKRVVSMDTSVAEPFLEEIVKEDPFVQFIYIVDTKGRI